METKSYGSYGDSEPSDPFSLPPGCSSSLSVPSVPSDCSAPTNIHKSNNLKKRNRQPAFKNWNGVLNNPTLEGSSYLKGWYEEAKPTYVCGQLEKGEEGTLHI